MAIELVTAYKGKDATSLPNSGRILTVAFMEMQPFSR